MPTHKNMRKLFSVLFPGLIILGLLAAVGYTAWEVYDYREKLVQNFLNIDWKIQKEIEAAYAVNNSFHSVYPEEQIEEILQTRDSIKVMMIYSLKTGKILDRYQETDISVKPNAQWNGKPAYSGFNILHFSNTKALILPDRTDVRLEIIHRVFPAEFIIYHIQQLAFYVLILIGVTLIFLIIYSLLPGSRGSAAKSGPKPPEAGTKSTQTSGAQDDPREFTTSFQPPPSGEAYGLKDSQPDENNPSMFSPATGLCWESFLKSRLRYELERAASFDQDLVLVLGDFGLGKKQTKHLREKTTLLKNYFSYHDLLFEHKESGFCAILPNIDIDHGTRRMEAFHKKVRQYSTEKSGNITSGLSSRNGRLLSAERLYNEAQNALQKAESDPGSEIISFRSDPEQFRNFVAAR